MTISQMREALKQVAKYNKTINATITWHNKVDAMSDKQVYAVYCRLVLNK
jgi:hypothetical protein|nr:MAG TPA: hypothetical protein [Caudoviricetes sp.]